MPKTKKPAQERVPAIRFRRHDAAVSVARAKVEAGEPLTRRERFLLATEERIPPERQVARLADIALRPKRGAMASTVALGLLAKLNGDEAPVDHEHHVTLDLCALAREARATIGSGGAATPPTGVLAEGSGALLSADPGVQPDAVAGSHPPPSRAATRNGNGRHH